MHAFVHMELMGPLDAYTRQIVRRDVTMNPTISIISIKCIYADNLKFIDVLPSKTNAFHGNRQQP